MNREKQIERLNIDTGIWDIAVIGGGATGIGIALDAALRGLKVVLLEAGDFSRGTSSRSTKLVHGGVRYLAKGDVGLVMEALYERGLLMQNAPHLVKNQSFVIPVYNWWEVFQYTVGLTIYDLLAGKLSLGRSIFVNAEKVKKILPTLRDKKLHGGVVYHDGQFDDARLALNMVQSCFEHGGCVINYMPVIQLLKNGHTISGIQARDEETGRIYNINAHSVINATGVFVDEILRLHNPASVPLVQPSQGVHIIIDQKFLQSENAIMIPKTDDGRVLFAIPWHGKVLIGTTDTVVQNIDTEPKALETEIDFILHTAGRYLNFPPERKDILSVFAGLRPLAAPTHKSKNTKEISRKHKIIQSESGLITITGGKWTTYRRMAEDAVDIALKRRNLPVGLCKTKNFRIHGFESVNQSFYGSDDDKISNLQISNPGYAVKLHEDFEFTVAHVIWAVREEMARTIEDILARRFRILFLDAQVSIQMAPRIAEIMAVELNKDEVWINKQVQEYINLAMNYFNKNT